MPRYAFVASCCYVGQGIVGVSVVSLVFAHYSEQFIPGLPLHLAAGVIVLAVIALNSFGISFTSKIIIGLMLVIVSLLGVYVFFLGSACRTKSHHAGDSSAWPSGSRARPAK